MVSSTRAVLVVAIAIVVVGVAAPTHAQIVYFGPGRGVVVRAPFAPPVSVGIPALGPGVLPVRPFLLPRRRALLAAPYAATAAPPRLPQGYAAGAAPRYAPGATRATVEAGYAPAGGDRDFPTAAELASFDDGTLLNATIDAAAKFDADVGRFSTGGTWQRYLRLPDDALPPATSDGRVTLWFGSIAATLARFDSVAADPHYAMISRLPSFVAAQQALREVVARFGPAAEAAPSGAAQSVAANQPQAAGRASTEELPMPQPDLAAPANAAGGERSILSR